MVTSGEARVHIEIRTVLVSWRAAHRSLAGDSVKAAAVAQRALALLTPIESRLDGAQTPDVAAALLAASDEIRSVVTGDAVPER